MVEEKGLYKVIANGKREYDQGTYSNYDFAKYYYSSTYVRFEGTRPLRQDLSNGVITVTMDNM